MGQRAFSAHVEPDKQKEEGHQVTDSGGSKRPRVGNDRLDHHRGGGKDQRAQDHRSQREAVISL